MAPEIQDLKEKKKFSPRVRLPLTLDQVPLVQVPLVGF